MIITLKRLHMSLTTAYELKSISSVGFSALDLQTQDSQVCCMYYSTIIIREVNVVKGRHVFLYSIFQHRDLSVVLIFSYLAQH